MPQPPSAECRADRAEHPPDVEELLDSLEQLLGQYATGTLSLAAKVHEGDVLVLTRSHTSDFKLGHDPVEHDPLNVAIRERLRPMVRLLGLEYGTFEVDFERRKIKTLAPAPSFTRGEFVGWLRGLLCGRPWRQRNARGNSGRRDSFRILRGRT